VFAHHEEEEEVYPLTLTEIADAQHKDQELKACFKKNAIMPHKNMGIQLIEDTKVLCKNRKVIIPTSLCQRAVKWYHHYLQHPRHSCLEERMRSVMYWKGMRTTIRDTSNLADLAKSIRDTARSMGICHQSWS
jgi:hypothetical protein